MSENKNVGYSGSTGYNGSKGYKDNNSNNVVTVNIDNTEVYTPTTYNDGASSSSDC